MFLETDVHTLETSVGIGYRDTEDDLGNSESEGIIMGDLDYKYVISSTATFNQKLEVESGDTNTFSRSETFLKVVVNGNLSAKFGYEVKRNSDVPAGTDKTDTLTAVTLVYGF